MKKKLIIASMILMAVGIFSCQKSDRFSKGSLETDLYTSVAEIVGTQISTFTGSVEHSLSLEKYDGHSSAFVMSGTSLGDFKIPGWGLPGTGHLKFGVPHVDSCATVTVSSITFPREIVVEYLGGCSTHKHDRKGKVIIVLSDTITNEGAIQTINYEDFYIDSIKVQLTATLKNLGKNSSGNWVIEKSFKQIITKNGEICERENDEIQEWLAGFETIDRSDNKYLLTGSGSVVINDTATYSKTITTPLLIDASCEFITSGVIKLDRDGSLVTIDYGDGTCDNKAIVTADGTTEEIDLHSNKFREGRIHHHHGFGNKGRG
jgi:hypothetical protein